jgi:hypothetical protein
MASAYAAQSFIPILNESAAANTTSQKRLFLAVSSMSAPTVSGPVAHIHYYASKFAQVRVIEMLKEQQHAANGDDSNFFASLHPGGVKSDFARQSNIPDSFLPCRLFFSHLTVFYFPL